MDRYYVECDLRGYFYNVDGNPYPICHSLAIVSRGALTNSLLVWYLFEGVEMVAVANVADLTCGEGDVASPSVKVDVSSVLYSASLTYSAWLTYFERLRSLSARYGEQASSLHICRISPLGLSQFTYSAVLEVFYLSDISAFCISNLETQRSVLFNLDQFSVFSHFCDFISMLPSVYSVTFCKRNTRVAESDCLVLGVKVACEG